MRGKYAWMQPGVVCRLTSVRREVSYRDGFITASFDARKNDKVRLLRTWREPGRGRMCEVEYLPPNFGKSWQYAEYMEEL